MATTKISTGVLKDGSVTSAKLDTNISIVGDLTVDTNTLFVDSASNNVGIGTSSPSEKLEVNGNISIPDTKSLYLVENLTTYGIGTPNLSGVQIFTGGNDTIRFGQMAAGNSFTERMRISGAGNVGIGESNPTVKLDVTDNNDTVYVSAGADQWKGIRIINTSPTEGDNKFSQLGFYVDGGTNVATGAIGLVQPDEDTRGGDLYFKTKNAGGTTTEHMRITSAGNVGIGTSSPSSFGATYKVLDLYGTNAMYAITAAGGIFGQINAAGTDALYIGTRSNHTVHLTANNSNALTIISNGNVGIGTSSPATPIHILSSTDIATFESSTTGLYNTYKNSNKVFGYVGTGSQTVSGGGVNDFGIQSSDNFLIATGGNVERMRIDASGDVLIGTTSDTTFIDTTGSGVQLTQIGLISIARETTNSTQPLLVLNSTGVDGHQISLRRDGVEKVTFGVVSDSLNVKTGGLDRMRLQTNGDLHVDGDVIAYSTTISDQRLKDDIQTIDNALDKVSNLRGVSYTWNNGNRKGQKDLGLIAQEVEQVLPELVREKEMPMIDGGTYKTVDYEKIVGVLIEAVKELKAEIESLKSK